MNQSLEPDKLHISNVLNHAAFVWNHRVQCQDVQGAWSQNGSYLNENPDFRSGTSGDEHRMEYTKKDDPSRKKDHNYMIIFLY